MRSRGCQCLRLRISNESNMSRRRLLQHIESTGRKVHKVANQQREIKTGQAYWELMERTAARVEKWPQWKAGERSARPSEREPSAATERRCSESDPRQPGH